MEELKQGLIRFINGFLVFALVLIFGVLLVKLLLIPLKKLLLKSKIDHTAKTFLFSILRVVLYGIVVITALGTAHVDITSIITALGAAALTAGILYQMRSGPVYQMATRSSGAMYMPSPSVMP